MTQKLIFIINGLSHSVNKKGSTLTKVAKSFTSAPSPADVDASLDVNGVELIQHILTDFDTLPAQLTPFLDANIWVIEGGDGTVQAVLSALIKITDDKVVLPRLILLPGGMTNLVAKVIGPKHTSTRKVTRLLTHALGTPDAPLTHMPMIAVNGTDASFHGFLLSTGALPAATLYCKDYIHKRGVEGSMAVTMTLIKTLIGGGPERDKILAPTPLSLNIDNTTYDTPHIAVIATSLPKLMIGMNPFWDYRPKAQAATDTPTQGGVRLTHIAQNTPIVRTALRIWGRKITRRRARKLEARGMKSWQTAKAHLKLDGPVVLDGEFILPHGGEFTLTTTRALGFIT